MKARTFQSKFWTDSFTRKLKPLEKLMFNYLITNEKVNIIFCYELSDEEIMFNLSLSQDELQRTKKLLQDNNKVIFNNGWVYLVNAHKYENYTGEKNDRAKEILISQMNNEIYSWYKANKDRGMDTPIHKGIAIPPIDHRSETIDKKPETIGYQEFVKKRKELFKSG